MIYCGDPNWEEWKKKEKKEKKRVEEEDCEYTFLSKLFLFK